MQVDGGDKLLKLDHKGMKVSSLLCTNVYMVEKQVVYAGQ